jgi:hypothetical protein
MWQALLFHGLADGLGHHSGSQRRARHGDQLDIGRAQSETLENLVLHGEAAGHGHAGDVRAFLLQLLQVLAQQRVQLDSGHAPLVHHAPRAHAGAASGRVHGEQIEFGQRGKLHRPRQVGRTVGSGLQENVLRAYLTQLLNARQE